MPYGPVKWLWLSVGGVTVLVVLLAVLFSSPDERPSTIARWSRRMPIQFLETADAELYGSSPTAEYGPPYNHNGEGQHADFLYLQKWAGVNHRIDTGEDFVLAPLRKVSDPTLQGQLAEYEHAAPGLRADGDTSYEQALRSASVGPDGSVRVSTGGYENVNNLMSGLLGLARSGGLERDLLAGRRRYQADYTEPLLLMSDGGLLQARAEREHLLDGQWVVMNETGSFPGQPWLWPYALWYQVEPFRASRNADILVMLVAMLVSLVFVCIPLLPGFRDLPRWLPLHRLIWREHYRASDS